MWSKEWPTKPGRYWFYGELFGDESPDFHYVEVWQTSNSIVCVRAGTFMYQKEAHRGVWLPVVLPNLPVST